MAEARQGATTDLEPATYGEQLLFEVPESIARQAEHLEVRVDDDGQGGVVAECDERDNVTVIEGPFCD